MEMHSNFASCYQPALGRPTTAVDAALETVAGERRPHTALRQIGSA